MAELILDDRQRSMLGGEHGPAVARSMRMVCGLARVSGARRLVPVESAHIDSCLYHGIAGLDFAEQLAAQGGRVAVPTTLNVSSLDLLHPQLLRADEQTRSHGRRLMRAYVTMGGRPTWTCAPYLVDSRPAFGTHVAWAESNAIAFVNSVLGARTDRYGDFLDICAAITGYAPLAGLHLDENRRPGVLIDASGLPAEMIDHELLGAVLGYLVGLRVGTTVPVIVGLPRQSEDCLKALGAAAASSGGVGLFHMVGSTPEAPTLSALVPEPEVLPRITLTADDLKAGRRELTTLTGAHVDAVTVGTPHCSLTELSELADLLNGRTVSPEISFYASTARSVLNQASEIGATAACERAGVQFVTDTCTYITPILRPETRAVMTNSAKWAHYAPGNLAVEVAMGSLRECVETACAAGEVRYDPIWQ